jgi:hypothetical protein
MAQKTAAQLAALMAGWWADSKAALMAVRLVAPKEIRLAGWKADNSVVWMVVTTAGQKVE